MACMGWLHSCWPTLPWTLLMAHTRWRADAWKQLSRRAANVMLVTDRRFAGIVAQIMQLSEWLESCPSNACCSAAMPLFAHCRSMPRHSRAALKMEKTRSDNHVAHALNTLDTPSPSSVCAVRTHACRRVAMRTCRSPRTAAWSRPASRCCQWRGRRSPPCAHAGKHGATGRPRHNFGGRSRGSRGTRK